MVLPFLPEPVNLRGEKEPVKFCAESGEALQPTLGVSGIEVHLPNFKIGQEGKIVGEGGLGQGLTGSPGVNLDKIAAFWSRPEMKI